MDVTADRPLTPYLALLVSGVTGDDEVAREALTADVRRAMDDVDHAPEGST